MVGKKYIFLLCLTMCCLCVSGCSTKGEKGSVSAVDFGDISSIEDFKCVFSTDQKNEFVINGDKAKHVYRFINEKWNKAVKTEIFTTEQNYIYLSFQDGDPLYILSQQPKANISDALKVTEEHFYGVFWIHENDYLTYTAMPITSFQLYYKLPAGTYNTALKMITE